MGHAYHFAEPRNTPGKCITSRQAECCDLMLAGRTPKETAFLLGISKRRVEEHLRNVCELTGSRTREQLAGKWAVYSEALKKGIAA